MKTMNNQYDAVSLYDGGWRSTDLVELMECYDITKEEAEEICKELEAYEKN